jgi:multicomponent Na+:H+ antiporter subunit B
MGVPNVVTSVLGSYRGFDTMGETAVVFTALVGVLLLLARGGANGHRRMDQRPGSSDGITRAGASAEGRKDEEARHG